jgi:hypothetical protein
VDKKPDLQHPVSQCPVPSERNARVTDRESELTELQELEEVFPEPDHTNRAVWRKYLPHAHRVLESKLIGKDDGSRIALEWKLAMCHYSDGQSDEAETFFRRVMVFRHAVLGAEYPDTLKSIAKMALTYHAQSYF